MSHWAKDQNSLSELSRSGKSSKNDKNRWLFINQGIAIILPYITVAAICEYPGFNFAGMIKYLAKKQFSVERVNSHFQVTVHHNMKIKAARIQNSQSHHIRSLKQNE